MDSRVLTILLTDMKGFTESSAARRRDEILDLVKEHDSIIRPVVEHFGGRVVKTIGDAFLVLFESPTNAVLAGLVIQHTLREHNAKVPEDRKIEVRVAINVGEVQLTETDVFGDAVNLASRINAITASGEVYFTEGVYLAMNKKEVPSSEIGEHRFKGVPEAVRLFHVIQDPLSDQYRRALERFSAPAAKSPDESPPKPPAVNRRNAWIGTGVALGAIAILGVLVFRGEDWAARARTFAGAGAFPEAWQLVDARFKVDPTDREVRRVAIEVLAKEVDSLLARDGPDKALERLGRIREERTYLTEVDEQLLRARRAKAANLMEDPYKYHEGINILAAIVKERPTDADAAMDFADAHARWRQGWASSQVGAFAEVLKRDPTRASDPRVKDRLLAMIFEKTLASTYSEAEALYDMVAKNYGAEVRPRLAPAVNDAGDPEMRAHSFGVLKRLGAVSPEEEFEYHRLNLFELDNDHQKRAAEYFNRFLESAADAEPFVKGKKWGSIPNFKSYGSWGTQRLTPFVAALFYEGCRDYLRAALLGPGDWSPRVCAFAILGAKGEITAEQRHRYHMLNLNDWRLNQLRYNSTPVIQAFEYLKGARLAPEEWRIEAVALLKQKQEEFEAAKMNRHIEKGEDFVMWVEQQLPAALKAQE